MDVGLSDYATTLERLFERTAGRVEPGLERTEALLAAIGNPHRRLRALHVAGTNGKGSTCATLDAVLRYAGYRVGRYTSPHLVDFRERVVVDGVPISEEAVQAWLARLEPAARAVDATFFEITTALALGYFAEARTQYVVLEAGLGGRLDSTNVVDPVAAAVTSIGLDHVEQLGGTLQAIADEKAGIFKPGRPAVIGEQGAELARRLAQRAQERGASTVTLVRESWRGWSVQVRGNGTTFMAQTPRGELRLSTPLLGEHQARNTLTALATLDAVGCLPRLGELNRALAGVTLRGRLQREGEWLFDVAHNVDGARVLARALQQVARPPVTAVVGILADKDWRGILAELAPAVATFVITQPETAPASRAWDPMQGALRANALGVPTVLEVRFEAALLRAAEFPGTKLVTGSFHTVGDALRHLRLAAAAGPGGA